jgi:hypothetical protein
VKYEKIKGIIIIANKAIASVDKYLFICCILGQIRIMEPSPAISQKSSTPLIGYDGLFVST